MKQLYFILCLFTFSNVFAQKIPWKTDLKLSPGIKYLHVIDPYNGKDDEYFFDKQGKLEKCISISSLVIDQKDAFRSQFLYKDSLLIKRENFYDDKLRYITKYDYENGNLILETELDVTENLITRQTSYCYLDGKLSSKLVVEKDGIDITEIKYNDSGSVSETKEYYGEDDLQTIVKVTEFNNVTIEEFFDNQDGKCFSFKKKTFVYDSNKNLLEFHYDYKDANGYHIYTYNNNVLANAKYYDEKDRLWMEEFYDDKGYIVKEVRPVVEFQKEEEIVLFKNYYNKRGDLIKIKRYMGRVRIAKFKIKYW